MAHDRRVPGLRNRPVAPVQLAQALGPDTLDTLQSQTGMDREALLSSSPGAAGGGACVDASGAGAGGGGAAGVVSFMHRSNIYTFDL